MLTVLPSSANRVCISAVVSPSASQSNRSLDSTILGRCMDTPHLLTVISLR